MNKLAGPKHFQSYHTTLVDEVIPALEKRVEELRKSNSKLALLNDVSTGLYEEVDKLCKKAPAETVTDLILAQVNTVISETKTLVSEDPFVARLNEFVAAGDNPQQRDVVVILKQLLLGQTRIRSTTGALLERNSTLLEDANAVVCALELVIEGHAKQEQVDEGMLKYNGRTASNFWRIDDELGDDWTFNFDRLDDLDLKSHFRPR